MDDPPSIPHLLDRLRVRGMRGRLHYGYFNRWGCTIGEDSICCPFKVGGELWVKEAFSLRYGNVWMYDADDKEVNRWDDDEWMERFEGWIAERIDDESGDELDSVSARSMPIFCSRSQLRVCAVAVEQRDGAWWWKVTASKVKT